MLLGNGLLFAGLFTPIMAYANMGDVSLSEIGTGLLSGALFAFPAATAAFAVSERLRLSFWLVIGAVTLLAYSFVRVQMATVSAGSLPGGYGGLQLSWGWLVIGTGAGLSLYAAFRTRAVPPEFAADPSPGEQEDHETSPTDAVLDGARLARLVAGVAIAITVVAIGWDIYKTAARRTPETAVTTTTDLPTSVPGSGPMLATNSSEASGEGAAGAEEAVYIRDNLRLYDLEARYFDSVLDGRIPGVLFKIKNNGDRTLQRVKVRVVFQDASGNPIAEEEYMPVLVSEYSYGSNNAPLRPNYIWQQESGRFMSAKNVPSEWATGRATATIIEIDFAPDAGS